MIEQIPTEADFRSAGLGYLNLAWDVAAQFARDLEHTDAAVWDSDGSFREQYWGVAQRALSNALALIQQGNEFLLKGRIAAVSPYLLISGGPRDWPRRCDQQDVPFSSFHTLDASDLIRVHNTVAQNRLPEEYIRLFDDLRRRRNAVMHTVDSSMKIAEKEIYLWTLESLVSLDSASWCQVRYDYLDDSPAAMVYSDDPGTAQIYSELTRAIGLLTRNESKRLLGFSKQARRYVCPRCLSDCGDHDVEPNLAQLAGRGRVACILCGTSTTVDRRECEADDCKSNVIATASGVCLLCCS